MLALILTEQRYGRDITIGGYDTAFQKRLKVSEQTLDSRGFKEVCVVLCGNADVLGLFGNIEREIKFRDRRTKI